MKNLNSVDLPIEIPIQITRKNNLPCIVLRKETTDNDLIKAFVRSAIHLKPIIIQPRFTDNLTGMASCIEKGILYRGSDGKYYFVT